jgi:hypothetical protein
MVAEVADDPSLTSHPFAQAHRALLAAYVSGLQGRIADSLSHLDVVDREVEVRKLHHFAGRTANYRAWLLRNLLCESEADDLNRMAAEVAGDRGLREAQVQAALDTADAHLRRGELADAASALHQAASVATGFAFDWKAGLRRDLLRARLTLEEGRPEEAAAMCAELEHTATGLGTPRYRTLAQAVGIRARGLSGQPVDPPSSEDVLEGLGRFATPEAWWVTAELARDLRVDEWWGRAERMIGILVEGAGPRGVEFGRQAGRRLDRMRSSRRRD